MTHPASLDPVTVIQGVFIFEALIPVVKTLDIKQFQQKG
jgi:hypothetical protein